MAIQPWNPRQHGHRGCLLNIKNSILCHLVECDFGCHQPTGISCAFLWLQDMCNSQSQERQFFPFSLFSKYCCNQMQYTPLAIPNSALWNVPTRFSNQHHYLIPKYLYHSESKPIPTSTLSPVPFPQQARQQPVHFVKTSLFWICHVSGIIGNVTFHVWLLSSVLTSPGFLHVSCVSTSFLFMPE